MTQNDEAERLLNMLHESKAGRDVRNAVAALIRAQAARIADHAETLLKMEELAIARQARAEAAEAEVARLRGAQTKAATDILAERQRQIGAEGWTHEHDDEHDDGELAKAGGAYALASTFYHADPYAAVLTIWPWPRAWLKPTNPRRDLVKAGALILAEIERLDRAALKPKQEDV